MSQKLRNQGMLILGGCAALLIFLSTTALGQSNGKIPLDVIDATAANGSAMVLVGLDVPWQMEANLSQEDLRAQRSAIATGQNDLLDQLAGRAFTVVRRYQEIPGIALEVGAEALAELARSPLVTNVLLDRPPTAASLQSNHAIPPSGAVFTLPVSEKVPYSLYTRAARDGTVLVLAGLRTPWQREDLLSDKMVDLQRHAILGVQSYLLAELAGTHYKVMRLYGEIPGIALRVGVDALKILERSPAITNVVPDRPAQLPK